MLTFRRPRPHDVPTEADGAPAWLVEDGCSEFRAVGIELQLIDAVDRRDQIRRGGVGELAEIEAEIARLHDELARASAAPLAGHHVDAA